MNKYLIIVLLSAYSFASNGQNNSVQMVDSVKKYLDSSLVIIEKNALNSSKVDWKELRKDVYKKTAGARTYEDILPVYTYIFEQIDDHHGSLKFKQKTYGWTGKEQPNVNNLIKAATKKYTNVRSERIGKDIGYILIPGNSDFRSQHMDSISRSIKQAIAKIHNKHIKGWIIDLRVNTGGNMYPMIAGLTEFLGEGKVGGFMTSDHQPDGNWIIKEGVFYVDSIQVSPVKYEGYPIKKDLPIAVLISGYTASSGEMTAITTIGRKNSIRIGENSAGYTTSNLGFELNGYSGLNLAVDYASDRNGQIYPKNLRPDVLVPDGDNFEKLKDDEKIKKAVLWLKNIGR
ncbi:S41 family peptidase [Pedobacter sp. PLR]|uniref:S41 family peptidase n=1 Tax=Pedobacter sp. PLR TaxID=2994465 RepID=UPI00224687E8|nr:S41 family peptidase [Pedobacter sp. PLR]MCX2452530.1 S41 family peptidase [Pedobacter sp. PLR]